MWRKVTPAPTDDTVVDVIRPPLIDRCDEWGDPIPSAVPPDEDDEDGETNFLSRLPWPEPPRMLSERPRSQEPLATPLSRSTGGVSRSVPMAGGVQHRAFWRGLGGTVFAAACLSVVLTRSRSKAPASPDLHALGAPAVSAAQRPPLPPPLFITIGNVSRAARATTKPSIDVTKLPVAPSTLAARQP